MAIYFLTEKRIKDFTTVLGNVDIKLISPLIPSLADQFIKPRTGSYYFGHLLGEYNSQSLNSLEEKLVGLIQNSLMWRVASELVITSSSQITNKGVQDQSGLNSAPTELTKLGLLTKHYGSKADFYDARIVEYLWKNKKQLTKFEDKLNMDCNSDLFPSKVTYINGTHFF